MSVFVNGTDDTDALAAALKSPSAVSRCMARGVASGWPDGLSEWVSAELNRPKVEVTDVLHALAVLQVQTFASLAAQTVNPDGIKYVVDLYVQVATKEMAEHAKACRAQMQEQGQ